MSGPPDKIKRPRPDWLWVVLIAGVITAGEFGLLIGTYSRDGTTWRTLHGLDTNTKVTSELDTPKTLTQVVSRTVGLPIASADPYSNPLAEANKLVVQAEPAPDTPSAARYECKPSPSSGNAAATHCTRCTGEPSRANEASTDEIGRAHV